MIRFARKSRSAAATDTPEPAGWSSLDDLSATISQGHRTGVDFLSSVRAIWWGTTVSFAGALVATTAVGLAAITGMILRGDTAEAVVAELPGSLALAAFVAAGGLLMNLAGGYTAAAIARHAQIGHAMLTGVFATTLNLLLLVVAGDSGPGWLTTLAIALVVPCSILGGWLAMPARVSQSSLSGF